MFKSFNRVVALLLFASLNVLAAHNPYRRNLELLLQEPSSGPYSKSEAAHVEELWLTQKVDHFDEHNNQTWQMRYLRNAQYHQPQGPIYIFVGGEWTISPGYMSTGLTHDMAVENAGMLYYTEHRYYGPSWPVSNNLSLEQLKYLSLQQALADLAHFINYQKLNSANLTNSKVILIGGSYSGSMVAWMTQLYPQLVSASWASSAPLLAKADFYEYMDMVSKSIELSYGSNCTQRIERGMTHLVKLLKSEHAHDLLDRLKACKNFNASDVNDRATFLNGIGNYFALIVQSYSAHIPQLCETLMSLQANDDEAFLHFLDLLYYAPEESSIYCQDFSYKAMLQLFTNLEDTSSVTRAWFYQTCNEFGWYTTTATSNSATFAQQVPLTYFEQLCLDAFGSPYTVDNLYQGIVKTNARFGGYGFNQSTRYRQVFFTHGQLDPWSTLGQQRGPQALVIPGYSHCQDLASINVKDDVAMNLAKLKVMSFLRGHLHENNLIDVSNCKVSVTRAE